MPLKTWPNKSIPPFDVIRPTLPLTWFPTFPITCPAWFVVLVTIWPPFDVTWFPTFPIICPVWLIVPLTIWAPFDVACPIVEVSTRLKMRKAGTDPLNDLNPLRMAGKLAFTSNPGKTFKFADDLVKVKIIWRTSRRLGFFSSASLLESVVTSIEAPNGKDRISVSKIWRLASHEIVKSTQQLQVYPEIPECLFHWYW